MGKRKLILKLKQRSPQFKTREWKSLRRGNFFWCVKREQRVAGSACLSRQERLKQIPIPEELEICKRCKQALLIKTLMNYKRRKL